MIGILFDDIIYITDSASIKIYIDNQQNIFNTSDNGNGSFFTVRHDECYPNDANKEKRNVAAYGAGNTLTKYEFEQTNKYCAMYNSVIVKRRRCSTMK